MNMKNRNLFLSFIGLLAISASAQIVPHYERPIKTPKASVAVVNTASDLELPKDKNRGAWDVWADLMESSITHEAKPITVVGTDNVFMFGGEKEGSSSRITRVMSPTAKEFKRRIREMDEARRGTFMKEFVDGFVSGKYRIKKPIIDASGKSYSVDISEFKKIQTANMDATKLSETFNQLVDQMHDQPFAFITQSTRSKIYNADFPGMTNKDAWRVKNYNIDYGNWKPIYGDAEKFLVNAHNTSVGWEMNFKPQKSYGEFEGMIQWYKGALSNQGVLFEAPGHQWLVFPEYKNLSANEAKDLKVRNHLAEIYKNMQAHTVLSGIEGGTGIEVADYKEMIPADYFEGHQTGRGVIRLDRNRFKSNGMPSFNVEQRAGTKLDKSRRYMQSCLISRYASGEMEDLANGTSYELKNFDVKKIAKRFDLTEFEVNQAISNLKDIDLKKYKGGELVVQKMNPEFWVPFWEWEKAPYIPKEKADYLKKLTQAFVKNIANYAKPSVEDVRAYLKTWVSASDIKRDIEVYLKPKPPLYREESEVFGNFVSKNPKGVDVNKVDLGIEYTARFPTRTKVIQTASPLVQTGKKGWVLTEYDLDLKEKEKVISDLAKKLSLKLNNGVEKAVVKEMSQGHGHSMVIAYEIKDANNKTWRVEWDGVGRDYDKNGKLIESSIRGGHIEVVTPKFNPSQETVGKVFESFSEMGLKPSFMMGGGHINVDLAAFEGKPKAMARFLSVFLENRATMGVLYQHPGRLASAEPHQVSSSLAKKLRDFNGTENELKELLYNEKFFNTRLGRKTKYSQLDVSAYFQDVIPEKYLTTDFDLKNDPWRKTFNLNPKIRKAEFRLFGAPRTQSEAESQIKLVRSMIDVALDESIPLSGKVQEVNYEKWVSNPKNAEEALENLSKQLHLDTKEYRGYMYDGLRISSDWKESEFYVPFEEKMKSFPRTEEWEEAVKPRTAANAINSEDVIWTGKADAESEKLLSNRRSAAATLENIREEGNMGKGVNLLLADAPSAKEIYQSMDMGKMNLTRGLDALYSHSRTMTPEEVKATIRELFKNNKIDQIKDLFDSSKFKQSKARTEWLLNQIGEEPGVVEKLIPQVASRDAEVAEEAVKYFSKVDDSYKVKFIQNHYMYSMSPQETASVSKLARSIDYSKVLESDRKLLANRFEGLIPNLKDATSLKESVLARKTISGSLDESLDLMRTIWKNQSPKLQEYAFKGLLKSNDRKSIEQMLNEMGKWDVKKSNLLTKLVDQQLANLTFDLKKMDVDEVPLIIKSYYKKINDPHLDKNTRLGMEKKFNKLFESFVKLEQKGESTVALERMSKIYFATNEDPKFAIWFADKLNGVGRSDLALTGGVHSNSPELRKLVLEHQWKSSKARFLNDIKSKSILSEVYRVEGRESLLSFLSKQNLKPKDIEKMKKFTDQYFFKSSTAHTQEDKKIFKEAFKVLQKSDREMEGFVKSLNNNYNIEYDKKNLLTKLYYSNDMNAAKVGSGKFYEAAHNAATHHDPLVRALALNRVNQELTPTGNRVMKNLMNDPYPRIQNQAKEFVKNYKSKLMTMDLADLEKLPPYERILLQNDLKTARSGDSKFMEKLTAQESKWAEGLTKVERDGLVSFYDLEFQAYPPNRELQSTMAETLKNMQLEESEAAIFVGSLTKSSDPKVLDIAFDRIKKFPDDLLISLFQAGNGSERANIRMLDQVFTQVDFKSPESVGKKLLNFDHLAYKVQSCLSAEQLTNQELINLRSSFMKIPEESRAMIYHDTFYYTDLSKESLLGEMKTDPSLKRLVHFFANENESVLNKTAEKLNHPDGLMEIVKSRQDRRVDLSAGVGKNCENPLQFLRQLIPPSVNP
jgi:hypothetical protein